jgi:uncharacterized protein YutE (UPF0331/DUF86 family)
MVDREIFSRRLAALHGYLEKLRAFGKTSEEEFRRTDALHDLAERYLHLAVECVLDLANHFIAESDLRTPETNQDTFTRLEEVGEIDTRLASHLRAWAGFRNVLVHEYLSIDHGIAWKAIQEELDDLETFARWASGKLD